MGEVYRATDLKLGRDVALKVLPAMVAEDPERLARFQREARAVAALNHPHIVTLFSVEEFEGVHFLTMELVEGQPLDRLIPAGGLAADKIVEIGGALAEALSAAHEKGIVHRDLKPANVMVTADGRVKVLDFGLAKDVSTGASSGATMTAAVRTEVGMVMGTPAYMSPEQVSGRLLDHRTDIFSMGVVLHEMATGQRPFDGQSSAELTSAILRDAPRSVTEVRPDLPADLARVIRRCLEKDPRHRVQTARDVANEFRDLARVATPSNAVPAATTRNATVPDSNSVRAEEGFWVAVLPFKHKGTAVGLDELGEGITEGIVTGLSRFSYLRVIARGSTAKFSGESQDIRAIGKELGARYVMEGSVRQSGTKLRLAVQLLDATTGAHLWAENYERAFSADDVFALQDDLVPRIVSTVADVHGVLPRSMSEAVRGREPDELSPYEAVLRSFGYFETGTPEELTIGRTALEAALRKAPTYADAWAMLGFLCCQDYVHAFNLRVDALANGAAAARRAVEAGPSNHLAYLSLAEALAFQKEPVLFRNAAERAIGLNPMDSNSLATLGELLIYAGLAERGTELAGRAKDLNPNHPAWYWFADFYNAFQQADDRTALNLGMKMKLNGHPLAPMFIAAAAGQLGEVEIGARAVEDLLKVRPDLPAIIPSQVNKVWNPEYGERFLEGLSKAGMHIPAKAAAAVATREQATRTLAKADSHASRAEEGFRVAVLPFKYSGGKAELTALAEGFTEDVVTGLSRFSYLQVIANSSTSRYAKESADVRTAGKELDARYVIEGSLRHAGSKLRLAVQLVDAVSGSHLWAENYERSFNPEAIFELQDELVPRIVSTVADWYGVLAYSMSELVRSKSPDRLSPYEALLRSIGYGYRVTAEEHLLARGCMERAVEESPSYADGWALLSLLYADEYGFGFNAKPGPLERALQAARRAADAAPSNSFAQAALARTLFFRKEFPAFRAALERAIALNPMDGATVASLGSLLAYSGDWERGCELVERAAQLNPRHPGWYWFPVFWNAYRKGDYGGALSIGLKLNLPGFFATHEAMAAAYGQLGESAAARQSIRDLLNVAPSFPLWGKAKFERWFPPELVEHAIDGLRKAGLELGERAGDSATSSKPDSLAVRAEEGFWVAVLPFKYSGATAELKALADGLSEEIVTGLSRFSYLRVIARGSTAKYSSESGDVRVIGKDLGARYVMEGSLRQAGTKLRLAVQLVDAATGTHLWAENYERSYHPESVFELQDDLVPRIVSTVADSNGVLPHTMSEVVRSRPVEELSPYEAVLRSFGYFERQSPEELVASRLGLESAVQKAPSYTDAWALLALLSVQDYAQGFDQLPNAMASALEAARRAVELGPSNPLAHSSLAVALFFHKEFQGFRSAAERALALNPADGNTNATLGAMLYYAGDRERGLTVAARAKELNPNHPGWYWLVNSYDAYHSGDYRGTVNFALKANLPKNLGVCSMLAAAYGQLGEKDAGNKAVADLLRVKQNFAETVRTDFEKFWDAKSAESVLEGLRKAGLKMADTP